MTDQEVISLFESCGALLHGHFVLTSGNHSDVYFEKFNVLNQPTHVEALCNELAERCRTARPDVVLGPTTLGILLAFQVAKYLGVRAAYGERAPDGSRFLRRSEHIRVGERVLVVDDVLTTGGSVRECTDLVERHGAVTCGVGILVDRSNGAVKFQSPVYSLLAVNAVSYPPDAVPEALASVPISQPGSTGKK